MKAEDLLKQNEIRVTEKRKIILEKIKAIIKDKLITKIKLGMSFKNLFWIFILNSSKLKSSILFNFFIIKNPLITKKPITAINPPGKICTDE